MLAPESTEIIPDDYEELADLAYSLAQVYTPIVVTRASDIQQADEYYRWLKKLFALAVKIETGNEIEPALFITPEDELT